MRLFSMCRSDATPAQNQVVERMAENSTVEVVRGLSTASSKLFIEVGNALSRGCGCSSNVSSRSARAAFPPALKTLAMTSQNDGKRWKT
jgi:hypothetical protein